MTNRNGGRPGKGSVFGKKPRPKKSGDPVFVSDGSPRLNGPRSRTEPQSLAPQTNKRLGEFTIERWSHDGRGLTSMDGKALFIQGALPGERVTARLVADHPRFMEARVDEVLEPSDQRVVPPCPHYEKCGGCQMQHIASEIQLAMKQDALLQQLAHWGKVVPRYVLPPLSAMDLGYRSRLRLGVWYETDGKVSLGFRQQGSHTITPISTCLVAAPELSALIAPLHAWLQHGYAGQAITHIELVHTAAKPTVILRHVKPLRESAREALALFEATHSCSVYLEPNGNLGLTDLDQTPIDPRLHYSLGELQLRFHPQDFTQVNPAVNQAMVAQALALLDLKPSDRVLDLFCGIGNFTLPIATRCKEVIGVEAQEAMVERGRENAQALGLTNVKFMAANLANLSDTSWQRLIDTGVDAILLDPPRDGAKEIVTAIKRQVEAKQLSPKRLVYVSCNPATLARDASILTSAGYSLAQVGVLDMFPHTSHVESMALFLLK